MPRHFKVEEILDEAEWREYKALLEGRPVPTVDALLEWMVGKGYRISRGAVWKHRKSFDERLDRIREVTDTSVALADAARNGGDLSEGNVLKFQQILQDKLFGVDVEELTSDDMAKLSRALRASVVSKRDEVALRGEISELRRREHEAVTAAENAAASGAGAADVVATIKKAMGITGGNE